MKKIVKKVVAYQTTDDKKFFDKKKAELHEKMVQLRKKKEQIREHLVKWLMSGGFTKDELFSDDEYEFTEEFLETVSDCSWPISDMECIDDLVELSISVAEDLNGVVLEAAKYVKDIEKTYLS